jgi:Trypsin-like peptidase domain
MQIDTFFFRLFKTDSNDQPLAYLGTAFPVEPDGGLLTCRHVVDVEFEEGQSLSVLDGERGTFARINDLRFPNDPAFDIAFLPNALGRPKSEFLPLLEPSSVRIGEDIYTFGYFVRAGQPIKPEAGYFKGNIINFADVSSSRPTLTLSYPVIEGLSGSPVLTYHNGPKVVGLAFGSTSSRVLASEVLEYEDGDLKLKESINRIVEFGLAHHAAGLVSAADELGAGVRVSTDHLEIPGLE